MIRLVAMLLALLAPAVAADEPVGAQAAVARLGLDLESAAEMSIRSEELELLRADDGR